MKKILSVFLILTSVFGIFALSFEDLEDAVYYNNNSVKTAREELTKALYDVKDAKAGLTPSIDLTVTGSYLLNPIDPIRINPANYITDQFVLGMIGNDYITAFEGQEKTYYQFSLSATQPLFTWGKVLNSIKIYESVYEVKQLQLDDAIGKANTELKTRMAVLFYLNKLETLLDEQEKISDRLIELSESALKNGMILETDALEIRVKASQIKVAKAQAQQQIMQMKTAIAGLTGIDVGSEEIEFDEANLYSCIDLLEYEGFDLLKSMALDEERNTFKLLTLLKDISEKTKTISAFSRNWIPDVALVVNANFQGSRFPVLEKDWYGKDDWDATITIAIKTTAFDGGKASNAYKKSQSDAIEAEINMEDAKTQIEAAFVENYSAISVNKAQIEYQEALKSQLAAKAAVQKNLLDAGYGSESDYLQVVLEQNNTEMEILQTKMGLAGAVYTVCYLSGI